ncbi:interferon regulatory factor 2-like isoform X2 [Orbicella faveolata]|uniref:interferon regulatory factor 2-like isoform X2 n=1 Tax=Orbicella faveolata TaxID=48498 RepID=UPI0009E5ECF5|nr:interferon regulatory factor 2-like isoform X2 [Orbicella faveolata]
MHDYSKPSGKKRLRFKDWLIERLDTGEIRGVQWIDRERGLFKIPWVHGSHKNWNLNDVEIFRQWAIYSGKYNPTDRRPDAIKWKTNFRCTLNALPDFKEIEVREESSPRGPKRYKIYSLKNKGKVKKGQNELGKEEKRTDAFDLTDKEIVQMVDDMMTPGPITRPALQKPLLITRARPNATYPAFETLVLGKSTETFPFSYTPWFLAAWNAMAVDLHVEKPEVEKSAQESVGEGNDSSEGSAEDGE